MLHFNLNGLLFSLVRPPRRSPTRGDSGGPCRAASLSPLSSSPAVPPLELATGMAAWLAVMVVAGLSLLMLAAHLQQAGGPAPHDRCGG